MVVQCWSTDPSLRPAFKSIGGTLRESSVRSSISAHEVPTATLTQRDVKSNHYGKNYHRLTAADPADTLDGYATMEMHPDFDEAALEEANKIRRRSTIAEYVPLAESNADFAMKSNPLYVGKLPTPMTISGDSSL